MLAGKVNVDIDFINEARVQCDAPVVKILYLVDDGRIRITTIKFEFEQILM